MKNKILIVLLIISLILIGGCNSTKKIVKEINSNNSSTNDKVVINNNKVNLIVGSDETVCSMIKSKTGCNCNPYNVCNLTMINSFKNGVYITIKELKIDVYDVEGNIILQQTNDTEFSRFLNGLNGMLLEGVKIGDKIKTTITKIKYGELDEYNCNIINETICHKESYVISEDFNTVSPK